MNDNVAKSLGEKLASLDLTDDEAESLVLLLGGSVESEVSGFKGGTADIDIASILPTVTGAFRSASWFNPDGFSFGVEREMKQGN